MSVYFDIGNGGFQEIRKDEFVDKSGLIAVMNQTIGTRRRLSLVSRPRRLGKSYAASMLNAYYCLGCDSSDLFCDLEIAADSSYETHRNQYHVLYLDIATFAPRMGTKETLVMNLHQRVCRELSVLYPGSVEEGMPLMDILDGIVERTGKQCIAIIDEWDSPIRRWDATEQSKYDYLEFLRSLFKNGEATRRVFAAGYMTGILPIKKDGSQSAISEFWEYSILSPGKYAPYIGFTEQQVQELCWKHGMDFAQMKAWYDGYVCGDGLSIYNSHSVMEAIAREKMGSYWRRTAEEGSMIKYINMDFKGLGSVVTDLLSGSLVRVNPETFRNDTAEIGSADDVLTLLIHYGYLSFDEKTETVQIPNDEIRAEFEDHIRDVTHQETLQRVRESEKILEDTVKMDADAVAAAVQKIHMQESSKLFYNNEQALRAVIKLAYFTYKDHYLKMEELDRGLGQADIVFLPKKYEHYPALIVELKAGATPEDAVRQIRDRQYADGLKGYGGEVLLVGITYDKKDLAKKHMCRIEKL